MTTWQVSASTDDCRVTEAGAAHPPWDTMDNLAAAAETCGAHKPGGAQNYYGTGHRFLNVTIPSRATITTAKLEFCARANLAANTVNTRITGEDADNPITFGLIADFNGRSRTTAFTDWDALGAWVANTWYDSNDFKAVIQEIIDRPGWASGQAMVLFWEDHGSTAATNGNYRQAYAWDDTAAKAAKLTVTWNPPTSTWGFSGAPEKAVTKSDLDAKCKRDYGVHYIYNTDSKSCVRMKDAPPLPTPEPVREWVGPEPTLPLRIVEGDNIKS